MVHMKAKIGEYAIVLNSKKEFLILQWGSEKKNAWHFLGGRLNKGEKAIEGLVREVKEEANLEIYDIKPIFTKIFTKERKYGVFFIAKAKEPYNIKISDEHQKFKWFKKSDLNKINFWQPFYKKILEDNL